MNDFIERFQNWQSTVPGIVKVLISILVIFKLVETSETQSLLDLSDQIMLGIAGVLTGVNGIMDVFKKDKEKEG